MIAEYSRTPTHTLANLVDGKRKNAGVNPIQIEEYIYEVIPCQELIDNDDSNGIDGDDNADNSNSDEE